MRKYRVKFDLTIHGELCAKAGDIVYDTKGYDYGCASDDTRMFGYEHISVSSKEDGDYPFFTIPLGHLEEIKD